MTAVTWAASPAYGQRVMLGPVQAEVYRFVMSATADGRRPIFTLGTIAERIGRPVSSVHAALGRLRALGIIGCAATMGRRGGHRLWRSVQSRIPVRLNADRHRRAIARLTARWSAAIRRDAPRSGPAPDPAGPDGALSLWPSSGPTFKQRMRDAGFIGWWKDDDRGTTDDRGRAADGPHGGDDPSGLDVAPREAG